MKTILCLLTALFLITTLAIANIGGMLLDPNSKFTFLHYFISLFLTIGFEIIVGLSFFPSWNLPNSNLKYIALCSLITHPIFWIIGEQVHWDGGFLIIGEFLIIFVEAILLKKLFRINMSWGYLIILSVVMNLISAIIGGIMYIMLTAAI